jgi:hypothetical protein
VLAPASVEELRRRAGLHRDNAGRVRDDLVHRMVY